MRNLPRKSSYSYLFAAVLAAAPTFHAGDSIQIEAALLNGRSDRNFLSDAESIKRYVVTQLPQGTIGTVEQVHPFKPHDGAKTGNTGLYIKIESGPHAGKHFWVLYRPDKNYLKLYDKKAAETKDPSGASTAEAKANVPAVHDAKADRAIASAESEPAEVANKVLDITRQVKEAGAAPKRDCHSVAAASVGDATVQPPQVAQDSEEIQLAPLAPITPTQIASTLPVYPVEPLSDQKRAQYLRSSDLVQSQSPLVQSLAQDLTRGKSTDEEKMLAVHDWITHHVGYDVHGYYDEFLVGKPYSRSYSAVETLHMANPTAICGGYAYLTAALLRASGIPTRVVEGTLDEARPPKACLPQNNHGWVEAYINGGWTSIDTTMDAGSVEKDEATAKMEFVPNPTQMYLDPLHFRLTHYKCTERSE